MTFAQFPNNMEGDWSGVWNNNNPLTDRGNVRVVTVQAGATGNRDFLFNDGPGDYMPEFKLKNFLANPQALHARLTDILTTSGNNVQFPATTGRWYTFIVEEATDNNDVAILETLAEPQVLDSVFRCPRRPTSSATVSLTAVPAGVLSAGEEVWVRYSTNGFSTSNFAQLTGNPLTVSLPAQADGTTVEYYFLTTTSGVTLSHADVDYQALTLFYQGISGTYFSYNVSDLAGTVGTPCDTFPTIEFCGDGVDNDLDGLIDGFDSDCGRCTGTLGDNVLADGDFGSVSVDGQAITQPDPNANPGVILGDELQPGITTYTYGFSSNFACFGGVNCFPDDGNYVIATSTNGMLNTPSSLDNWIEIQDNGPEPDGYMMVVNSASTPGLFYVKEVGGLCPNTVYEFSIDVINLLTPSGGIGVFPNIDFLLAPKGASTASLQVLGASASTDDVPQDSMWHNFGFTFTPTADTITLALRSNNPGGMSNVGNDLAIDNISFRPCGPVLSASGPPDFCPGNTILLDGTISAGYANPDFQWQFSDDGGQTWTNIAGATQVDYAFVSADSMDAGLYRLLASEGGHIDDSLCRIASDTFSLAVVCPLAIDTPDFMPVTDKKPASLIIYPNPTTAVFSVDLAVTQPGMVWWEVTDMVGKKVLQQQRYLGTLGRQSISISLEDWAAGVYGIKLMGKPVPNGYGVGWVVKTED